MLNEVRARHIRDLISEQIVLDVTPAATVVNFEIEKRKDTIRGLVDHIARIEDEIVFIQSQEEGLVKEAKVREG